MSAHAPVAFWRRLLSFVVGAGVPFALSFPLSRVLSPGVRGAVVVLLALVLTWGVLAATGWGIWFTLMIVIWLAPWKPK